MDGNGITADRLAQEVADWLIQYARLHPLDPVPEVHLLAELRREVLAALQIVTTLERSRCARIAEQAGYPVLARRILTEGV